MGKTRAGLPCLGKTLYPRSNRMCPRKIVSTAKNFRCRLIFFCASLLVAANLLAADAGLYSEPFRPQFHFTPPRNWMNDPNGLVFYEGEYHLFYQFNPDGNKWGHMSWGHAVSTDLVHWQHLPVALPEENGIMIFSGSAVIDWRNSSGFGQNGRPPMVAVYTGYRGADGAQFQCVAFSNDKGRTWTKYAGNPVIDIGSKEFRDPKVRWHEPTHRWVMSVALSADHQICFYHSPDLKHWELTGKFGPQGAVSGAWECPDMFELPVEGTADKRWVLTVNTGSGSAAGGSGTQYFIGQFDGANFIADRASTPPTTPPPLWTDYGKDYYAAVSWSDIPTSDGRRLWLGWMSNLQYAGDVPTTPWRSAMSIPREIHLRQTAAGVRMTQSPVRELEKIRGRHHLFSGGTVSAANAWLDAHRIGGACLELIVDVPAQPGTQGIRVRKGESESTTIGVDHARGMVFIDRRHSGRVDFNPAFAGVQEAPLFSKDRAVTLHIYIDASSVEVFVNNGERVLTDLNFPAATCRGLEMFSSSPPGQVGALNVWELKSIWN